VQQPQPHAAPNMLLKALAASHTQDLHVHAGAAAHTSIRMLSTALTPK
jgi:hypothetical protein